MSLTVIVLLYIIFCLLTFGTGIIAGKIIAGFIYVHDLVLALILSFIPLINLGCLIIFLIVIAGIFWTKAAKWYNGVKYYKVW